MNRRTWEVSRITGTAVAPYGGVKASGHKPWKQTREVQAVKVQELFADGWWVLIVIIIILLFAFERN